MRSILLCLRGKNLTQEEKMNVQNDIEMSESLLPVQRQ